MRTRAERKNLAIVCAASHFKLFSDKANRGPNWSKDEMPSMIGDYIKLHAYLSNVPEKHHEQMKRDGLDFYSRYLESTLVE